MDFLALRRRPIPAADRRSPDGHSERPGETELINQFPARSDGQTGFRTFSPGTAEKRPEETLALFLFCWVDEGEGIGRAGASSHDPKTARHAWCETPLASVMPDLIRHPAVVRLRDAKSLFRPGTWSGWIPDRVRYDERRGMSIRQGPRSWREPLSVIQEAEVRPSGRLRQQPGLTPLRAGVRRSEGRR